MPSPPDSSPRREVVEQIYNILKANESPENATKDIAHKEK
jgi:hypothetical protein